MIMNGDGLQMKQNSKDSTEAKLGDCVRRTEAAIKRKAIHFFVTL